MLFNRQLVCETYIGYRDVFVKKIENFTTLFLIHRESGSKIISEEVSLVS